LRTVGHALSEDIKGVTAWGLESNAVLPDAGSKAKSRVSLKGFPAERKDLSSCACIALADRVDFHTGQTPGNTACGHAKVDERKKPSNHYKDPDDHPQQVEKLSSSRSPLYTMPMSSLFPIPRYAVLAKTHAESTHALSLQHHPKHGQRRRIFAHIFLTQRQDRRDK
jgi:hypothetical protein